MIKVIGVERRARGTQSRQQIGSHRQSEIITLMELFWACTGTP